MEAGKKETRKDVGRHKGRKKESFFFFFFLGATARVGLWSTFFFRGFRNNDCFTGWGC
jgi:hypothetical protein